MRVLVTGARGFVGQALCPALWDAGHRVIAAVRNASGLPEGFEVRLVDDIGFETDWTEALQDVEAVVHLAARVHVMRESAADPLAAFRQVNTVGTLRLARAAAEAGVRRFVFLSSVKVLGETCHAGSFTDASPPNPRDPYAVSKWEGERGLSDLVREFGMEVVILRPPLVYGPGVRANFLSLLGLVHRGVPLPLGAVRNQRSLLSIGNLVDAIRLGLTHPAAPGGTFLLRDGEDLSTAELVRRLGAALGRRTALFPVPASLLKLGAGWIGRSAEARRLLGSLTVDDRPIRQELGWNPPFTVDEGLVETAVWFRATGS